MTPNNHHCFYMRKQVILKQVKVLSNFITNKQALFPANIFLQQANSLERVTSQFLQRIAIKITVWCITSLIFARA